MQAHPQSSLAARNLSIFPSPQGPQPVAEATSGGMYAPQAVESASAEAPTPAGMGLAQDAGNLLGALSLYCDLLDGPGVLPPEHRHYASELRLIYQRSGALIQRLLKSEMMRSGDGAGDGAGNGAAQGTAARMGRPLAPGVHLSPAETLRELTPTLTRMAAPAAHVTVEVAPQIPHVNLPAEAVERIAVNLVRNAAEAIQNSHLSAGRIRVWLGVVCGRLRLSVEDNGPGMPPTLAAAFLHPAPLPAGTQRGYGHRNVHELAATTGGRLGIHVRPGRGTTLCVDWQIPSTHLHAAKPTERFARLSPAPHIAALRMRPETAAAAGRSQTFHPPLGEHSA